ncbi:serine/threonine/tyrosine-interacting-like protein 1 isoform X3 [Falco biarmicus]|uniref:serine/threonine/tyrosine-interacting-like protein 1 isoform X1 n=1 Tax=Falco peregrinus TaxID=8954 RepID=UPI0006793B78|nr:serine/threonine/tyrosine-interacting-like protein 1 isoform X1 [Falco peregrinus]XP_037230912.1 serine/threonine/tyrosine-interacting-like protein 1 isoform X3 [Falco rusticolus]XP_055571353.1 serine/threonine/tyrosine-interacting-like protein 1 isoform X1 [Falco cherrug]XP_056185794.1 serine/threonine/tyrosine-interacting-like protein 1 isoform X3 [Falco biarmicus]
MAGIALCEPHCLYNIVSQKRRVSRLAEANYLCLLDARTQHEYNESHIITARRIEQSPTGEYLVPDSEELRCVRYCVVYDCETSSLDCCDCEEEEKEKGSSPSLETENTDSSSVCSQNAEEGSAIQHARALEQFTRHPVLILRGGYKRFSACYHFLRTQKILWMPQQELDNFQPYPVEILPEKLYMGNFKQACDQQIQRNLKIKAQVNISEQPATLFAEGGKYLHIPVPDSLEADLFSSFATICHFIDAQLDHGAVLVFSSLGISRSSTATMAYLMNSCQFSLKRAWDYVLQCKTNMRPHRGFVKQLSDWETQIYGTTITDISEPNY